MERRRFLQNCALTGVIALSAARVASAQQHPLPADGIPVPDEGWRLWLDKAAPWQDDPIFLPADVQLRNLRPNPPTGGWNSLYERPLSKDCISVTLPATVEQYFWGQKNRSYTPEEYRYAADDPVPQNGAYAGVSWWWRNLSIPSSMRGQRILLYVRGARMRAEIYLNEQLVGYSIMEELPFECDLTDAARPGAANRLAIRITNPGGRYDWVDGTTITWGKVNLYRSHGFGGVDRGITLRAVPADGHIADAWILNTPEPRTVFAHAKLEGKAADTLFEILELDTDRVLASAKGEPHEWPADPAARVVRASLQCPAARLWDLDTPALYRLRAANTGGKSDVRIVSCGFRWFAPEGIGTDAIFRLNGRRIKLYSSISWGYWGHNGLWPTPELAEREVVQAKRLGLNCLNFHRNVGKEDVLRAHDRLGLLRYMEPGGGKLGIGKLPSGVTANAAGITMQKATSEADRFSQQFMLEKCRAMVRAFRSHPSLIQYTLQNEIGADLRNPETFTPVEVMHREDPSRIVALNDGFSAPPRNAAQVWYEPYSEKPHRTDQEPWGGWWNNHQGSGDQWYDDFYKDAGHFTYRQPLKESLVEFGEMEGCAVADNHALMVRQIEKKELGGSGNSYDLEDHRQILAAYDRFLDRWGFRKAFPKTDDLFLSLGNKSYESWQQYMENARICDAIDFAVISGWESTAIENHSGIVDNLRNFKGDPKLIASSLRPVCLVAKQHKLCYAMGDSAVLDLYLLNDTGRPLSGKLRLSMVSPAGDTIALGAWDTPALVGDQFSYTIQTAFTTPPFSKPGIYPFHFSSESTPAADSAREIWVADTKPDFARRIKVGVSALLASVRKQLASLPGLDVEDFAPGQRYDVLIASGVVKGSKLDRQIGDETGLEAQPAKGVAPPAQPSGHLPGELLAAVKSGTPLLVIAPDDFLADGVAKQLAELGALRYEGQVGDTRAPWMGNWLFVREHPSFAQLPANRVLSVHYQTHGKQSNGLLIERASGACDPEVIMGYSRDHDRKIGAASFICYTGTTPVLFHRAPEFSAPLQLRWLAKPILPLASDHRARLVVCVR
jgi:hypothetical protein